MAKITTVLGFDMETDIGSWTSFYEGFGPGTREILRLLDKHGISAKPQPSGETISKYKYILKQKMLLM